MPAPLVGLGIGTAAKLVAKKAAANAAKKRAAAALKNVNKPIPKSNKPLVKITGVKPGVKKTPGAKVTPRSNVRTERARQDTQRQLDKIRTPAGQQRALNDARITEQTRIDKAAKRLYDINMGIRR